MYGMVGVAVVAHFGSHPARVRETKGWMKQIQACASLS